MVKTFSQGVAKIYIYTITVCTCPIVYNNNPLLRPVLGLYYRLHIDGVIQAHCELCKLLIVNCASYPQCNCPPQRNIIASLTMTTATASHFRRTIIITALLWLLLPWKIAYIIYSTSFSIFAALPAQQATNSPLKPTWALKETIPMLPEISWKISALIQI